MNRLANALGAVAAVLAWGAACCAAPWKPAELSIPTPWTANVSPDQVLPEYPRPQMVRPQWTNLNGLWDYAITPAEAPRPEQFAGQILVPFPIESALSGVKREFTPQERLWYRRTFAAPDLAGGKRLLLHFGAVDHDAVVTVNGREIGSHQGGYDSFTFDVTDAVHANAANELVVAVRDTTGANGEPKGKQNLASIRNPSGIMYTPCSGIWQTVWLEAVPAASIASLRLVPDVDHATLHITVAGRGDTAGLAVEAAVLAAPGGDRELSRAPGAVGSEFQVAVPQPKLWSPDAPSLYGLQVSLVDHGRVVDTVDSYFGMRKIALGKDEKGFTRMLLNGQFVFQAGPLDQGFWPDGIYTAPTDEALRYDIEITKKLGFNMCRKHVKVEPARWYYWCDKLGLLVWQDMPGGNAGKPAEMPRTEAQPKVDKHDKKAQDAQKKARREWAKNHDGVPASPEKAAQFEKELRAMVEQHINCPSIIVWVVFNEGWGQYETQRLTAWVKQLDPSRLTNNASGWTDHHVGDLIDMHNYPGPGCPAAEPQRAAVLGEFGGLGLPTKGHTWVEKNWGYRGMADNQALTRKYLELWRNVYKLRDEAGLCAAVYTQTTDVETECNGLLTYDRRVVKVDLAAVAAGVGRGEFPPEPTYETLVPTAEKEPVLWRYTTRKPADDWFQPGFDAATWAEGPAGFGHGAPNTEPRTPWKTDDIWLRREFTLPEHKPHEVALRMYHDEDADVYFNGMPAGKFHGYVTNYENLDLPADAVAALRPGKNVMAIHCHQTMGGQYIDAGLELVKPAGKK